MKEVLPPETDFQKLAALAKIFGTSGELKAAEVGFISRNPFAVATERLRGEVGVEVPGQGGLIRQALEAVGLGEIQVLRREDFDAPIKFMERVEKEGGGLPNQPAADKSAEAMERAATAMESAAAALQEQADQPRTVVNHYENAKFIGPDAGSLERRSRYGSKSLRERAG